MDQANIHRYTSRATVDRQIHAMRDRIVAERRTDIGVVAARNEATEVTANWWRAEYQRIENEVYAQWGAHA